MKIAIIGSGGVGGYFGARLSKAGNDVIFFARGEHLQAMRSHGLMVKSIMGDVCLDSVKVTDSMADTGTVDIAIISVKCWQISQIVQELRCIIGKNTMVLPLQNGISTRDELKELLINPHSIVGGVCSIMSRISSPGTIDHFWLVPSIILGEFDGSLSARCQHAIAILHNAGIQAELSTDIIATLWRKFIMVCVGGLLAVTKTTYGEMREIRETNDMMVGILHEGITLAQKFTIQLEPDFITKALNIIGSFPYNATASLTRDVWNGLPSEVDYLNGAMVKLSKECGIAVPINEFVYNCILPGEVKARKHHHINSGKR